MKLKAQPVSHIVYPSSINRGTIRAKWKKVGEKHFSVGSTFLFHSHVLFSLPLCWAVSFWASYLQAAPKSMYPSIGSTFISPPSQYVIPLLPQQWHWDFFFPPVWSIWIQVHTKPRHTSRNAIQFSEVDGRDFSWTADWYGLYNQELWARSSS